MNDSDAPEQTAYYPQYITAPKGLPGTQEAAGCTEEPREISGSRIARCALSKRYLAPISRLLNLIRPEDIDRWKYPLAELQRDLDDTIDTFASLGRS